MRRIVSFGGYLFPDTQGSYSDNFLNTVTRTTRLPGLSGGFDELGIGPAPSEVGNISLGFWLIGSNVQEMQQMKDELRGLATFGVRQLVLQPIDPTSEPRTCYARVSNISMSENAENCDELFTKVSVNFQVPYPRWEQAAFTTGTSATWGSATWGSAVLGGGGTWQRVGNPYYEPKKWGAVAWGSGTRWGGSAPSPTTETLVFKNNGNAPALVRLFFTALVDCPGGITIERVVNEIAVEAISLAATKKSQTWEVNGRSLSVKRDGKAAYDDFSATTPRWLTLPPGSSSIRFNFPQGGGGNLKFEHHHTWV